MKTYIKDPDASLDYTQDWSDWLGTDTISSFAVVVDAGITQGISSNTTTTCTCWFSGGVTGESYTVTYRITTAAGRVDDRSFIITVANQ
jgi:hypothetical protein